MESKVFVFDLDDTLSDTDSFSESYIWNFIKKNNLPFKHIEGDFRFAEMNFDWDTETALKWYKQYGDEMMLNFPVKVGAKELINSLFDAGHKIIISTARATDWHTDPEGITLKWLENVGIKYSKIYIGRNDKEEICVKENADFFVDDDLKITQKVANKMKELNKNCNVFLSTTRYNREMQSPEGVVRLNDLKEIFKYIQPEIEVSNLK